MLFLGMHRNISVVTALPTNMETPNDNLNSELILENRSVELFQPFSCYLFHFCFQDEPKEMEHL